MSGRISAIAATHEPSGKITVFVGAASGGVWKSEDGGTRYRPIFDEQDVQSIGAIEIDPKHTKNIWVGTGESWTRNSVSIGDGIYKSNDGGETWTHSGLDKSERISKILVDPNNSDVVYAAVPGALWSDSADRGLYKTTDGGKTWNLILKGSNLSTGCSDHRDRSFGFERAFRRTLGFSTQRLDVSLRRRRSGQAIGQWALPLVRRRQDLDGADPGEQQRFSEETLRPHRGCVCAFESEARLRLR